VRIPLLPLDQRRIYVQRVGLVPITAQEPGIHGVAHLPQAHEPGVLRLRIPHAPSPIAQRSRIGECRSVQQTHQPRFTSHRPQIFQAPPSGLEHQDQPIHKHRRGIAPIAPRARQISIRQPADAQPMSELGQQRQAPRGREGLVRPFQLEG